MIKRHTMTAARRAALKKAQLASARKRHGLKRKSSKKLSSRISRARGIEEYTTRKGKKTGWATNTAPSRTFGSAMRKGRRAGRYNKKLGNKQKRLDKKIARLKYRETGNKHVYTKAKRRIKHNQYGYKGPA